MKCKSFQIIQEVIDQGGSSRWFSKGIEQNYTEVCSIIEERQRRLGVFGKEKVFYIFVSLVFSGCSSWLSVHQELCLGQLHLCNTVPFLYKFKGLGQVGKPTIFLCVLYFS